MAETDATKKLLKRMNDIQKELKQIGAQSTQRMTRTKLGWIFLATGWIVIALTFVCPTVPTLAPLPFFIVGLCISIFNLTQISYDEGRLARLNREFEYLDIIKGLTRSVGAKGRKEDFEKITKRKKKR